MGLLDSEAGKRRLLSVEIPVIERYNEGREPAYKIQVSRLGGSLVLRYRLKPVQKVLICHVKFRFSCCLVSIIWLCLSKEEGNGGVNAKDTLR